MEEINNCIAALKNKGVIITPTDTILGLAVDAKDDTAITKLIELKKRDSKKSFIILIDDVNKIENYVSEMNPLVYDLIEFSEKPLTLVLPGAKNVSPLAVNADGSIGIRVVKEGFMHQLLRKYRSALVSTSVNISGEQSALNVEDIPEEISLQVDYIANVNNDGTGSPSSIIRLEPSGKIEILRK